MPPHIGDPAVRTDGRFTTEISWLDRLPNLLNNGALLARFAQRLRLKLQQSEPS